MFKNVVLGMFSVFVSVPTALASPPTVGLKGPDGRTVRFSYDIAVGKYLIEVCKPYTDLKKEPCDPTTTVHVSSTELRQSIIDIGTKNQLLGVATTVYSPDSYSVDDKAERAANNQVTDLEAQIKAASRKINDLTQFEPKNKNIETLKAEKIDLENKKKSIVDEIQSNRTHATKAATTRQDLKSAQNTFADEIAALIKSGTLHYRVVDATDQYESGPVYTVLNHILTTHVLEPKALELVEDQVKSNSLFAIEYSLSSNNILSTRSYFVRNCFIAFNAATQQYMVIKKKDSNAATDLHGLYFKLSKSDPAQKVWRYGDNQSSTAHTNDISTAYLWLKAALDARACD